MRFILNGDTLITPAVEGAQAMDVNMVRYYKQTPKGTLTVQIMQTDCTNSMTGEQADYKVMIDIQRNGETDPALAKHYEGCGRYIPDFRLEGKWVLKQLNGVKPDTASYPRGVPDLELRVVESRYGGLAGCNRMMGKIIKGPGNKIRFGPAATTLMFCPNMNKEQELTQALSQVDTYRVMRDQLQLVVRGKTTLIYGRGSRGYRGKKGRK
jgi:heat shock protein HslJ